MYLTDDSKLLAADYDQIASTPLPDVLGKNYIDHQDFNLLPDTIKTLPPVKLDEKTQFIGVVAYFSDDRATEWKQIETVEGNLPPLPPAGACTSKQHRNEKEDE